MGGAFLARPGAPRDAGLQAVRRALELGVNYIDTARSYANSEEVIGAALAGIAEDRRPYVATKVGKWPQPFDPKDRRMLQQSVAESLRVLGQRSVAGLLVHEPDRPAQLDWWDDDERAEGPVIDVLEELRAAGTIRFTGLAGTTAYELARRAATGRFDVVLTTFNYSLLWREAEHSVLPEAERHDMGIVVGTPLQQGALAQRYDAELETATWLNPPRKRQYQELYALLDDLHMPIHELALRWVISNPRVSTVIAGARSVGEVEANVEAVEKGALEPGVLRDLDRIAALVPFRPFEEPSGAFGLPFGRPYRGPGPLFGTGPGSGPAVDNRK